MLFAAMCSQKIEKRIAGLFTLRMFEESARGIFQLRSVARILSGHELHRWIYASNLSK